MAVVCDVYKSCVIFNEEVTGMKITAQIMKSKYCTDNFSRCICYKHSQDRLKLLEMPYHPPSEKECLEASS